MGGWNLAITDDSTPAPASLSPGEVDKRIASRIDGELQFLDGYSWPGIWALSKKHRATLAKESVVMSVAGNTHCFMHNPGVATVGAQAMKSDTAGYGST